jgi:hypothetical protein
MAKATYLLQLDYLKRLKQMGLLSSRHVPEVKVPVKPVKTKQEERK